MTAKVDFTPVKTCTKCGECKPATAEYFLKRDASRGTLKTICLDCAKDFRRTYYAANKAALLADNRAYREANREEICAQRRAKYAANRDVVIERNLAYRDANREAHRARVSRNSKKRREIDPIYAMRKRVTALISIRLRAGGYTKKSRSQEILGCDWEAFKLHIERQFLKGMTWENRAMWQLDHIVPLATAATEADILALNHYTNLRPMWSADNRAKSDKITHLI